MLEVLDQDESELMAGLPAVEEQPRTGTTVGRYEVLAPLDHGGMGEVYAGWDTALDRTVALKFLVPEQVGVPSAAARFVREAKAASALNHPNIVTVHEVLPAQDSLVIVMELIEGQAARKLCGAPVPLETLLNVGRQTALALATAHAHGIVHRDVKPENIMVRTDGYVKLVDFGLARHIALDRSTAGGFPAGTLRYMSPEQIRGEPLTSASDIFSLGLVLYELAAGQHPYAQSSTLDGAVAIVSEPVPDIHLWNPSLPPALASLIGAMLSKEPSQRPAAAEVGASLRCISDSAHGSRGFVPGTAGALRKPRVWPAMAVALFGLVIFSGLLWLRDPHSSKLPELRSWPLTSNAGWEESPVFSPDGESVAFRWTRKLNEPWQIYVKRLDADGPVQLTHPKPGENIGPIAWSPDGNSIAFKAAFTVEGRGAVYTIPKQGGEAVRLVDLFNANFSSSIDWSPDGTQVVFSDALPATDQLAIYTFNVHTGEKRKLTSPPAGDWGDWDPQFSPDGRTLAFKRVQGFWSDAIYLMPASGGPARRVTNGSSGIWGHAWMPNGNGLIVSTQRGGSVFGLWRFPLTPEAAPVRITGGGLDAITPASGRGVGRVAWVNRLDDTNIYRVPMKGDGAPTAPLHRRVDERACYSPDGRIAFASDRSGSWEIWMASSDGSNQVRVTSFGGPLVGFPRWSPDGRHLAFETKALGRGRIFVLECQSENARCGEAKPLTAGAGAETSTDALPSWSADGAYVYFTSNRTGRDEIWKQALAGGAAIQVTRRGGYASYESRDGNGLLFEAEPYSIWRMPGSRAKVAAESAELLIGPPVDLTPTGWTVTSEEILFIGVSDNVPFRAIRGYRLATGEIRTLLNLPEISERGTDLSASPDSRWLLYGQLDRSGSNIVIAETGQ